MLKNLKKTNSKGFTIIEVMIVLAIAGLILLIVFLAVPALQRNARNTQRKNDVASLVSAISEATNNNGGQLPTSASTATGLWKPGFYTAAEITTWTMSNTSAPASPPADPASGTAITVENYVTCNSTGTAATTTGASARSVAVLYDVETGGGTQEQCVTAQ